MTGLGATHHIVVPHVREEADELVRRFGGSWNTYKGHGLPPAKGERFTVDLWAKAGRGHPLPENVGDAMAAWLLGNHVVVPLRILIWWSWVWTPQSGWRPYSGFQGNHGPGKDAHLHVGFD